MKNRNTIYIIDSITTAIAVSRMKVDGPKDVIFECNIIKGRDGSTLQVYERILEKVDYNFLGCFNVERPYDLYSERNFFKKINGIRSLRKTLKGYSLEGTLKSKIIVSSLHSVLLWSFYSKIKGFIEIPEGMEEIIFPREKNILKSFIKKYILGMIFPTNPRYRYILGSKYLQNSSDILLSENLGNFAEQLFTDTYCLTILNTPNHLDNYFGSGPISKRFIDLNFQIIFKHHQKTNGQYKYILKSHPASGNISEELRPLINLLNKKEIRFIYVDEIIDCRYPFYIPSEYLIESLGILNVLLCDITSTVFNYKDNQVKFTSSKEPVVCNSKRNKKQFELAMNFFKNATNIEYL
jgi:hypothetical protein